jgi:hypothetical protein
VRLFVRHQAGGRGRAGAGRAAASAFRPSTRRACACTRERESVNQSRISQPVENQSTCRARGASRAATPGETAACVGAARRGAARGRGAAAAGGGGMLLGCDLGAEGAAAVLVAEGAGGVHALAEPLVVELDAPGPVGVVARVPAGLRARGSQARAAARRRGAGARGRRAGPAGEGEGGGGGPGGRSERPRSRSAAGRR